MDPELRRLIRAFQDATRHALAVVLRGTGLTHPFDRRQRGVPPVGTFIDADSGHSVHYAFHGIGLAVRIGPESVDFDFGYDGRTTGFNEWWLRTYAEARPDRFPTLSSPPALLRALEAARIAGEIVHSPQSLQDSLEYLKAEVPVVAT